MKITELPNEILDIIFNYTLLASDSTGTGNDVIHSFGKKLVLAHVNHKFRHLIFGNHRIWKVLDLQICDKASPSQSTHATPTDPHAFDKAFRNILENELSQGALRSVEIVSTCRCSFLSTDSVMTILQNCPNLRSLLILNQGMVHLPLLAKKLQSTPSDKLVSSHLETVVFETCGLDYFECHCKFGGYWRYDCSELRSAVQQLRSTFEQVAPNSLLSMSPDICPYCDDNTFTLETTPDECDICDDPVEGQCIDCQCSEVVECQWCVLSGRFRTNKAHVDCLYDLVNLDNWYCAEHADFVESNGYEYFDAPMFEMISNLMNYERLMDSDIDDDDDYNSETDVDIDDIISYDIL